MAKRDFLAVTDLSKDDITRLFDLASRMKRREYRDIPLAGKTLQFDVEVVDVQNGG